MMAATHARKVVKSEQKEILAVKPTPFGIPPFQA
jgi:hypothetical protein